MIRETFPVGILQCNCTILGDENSREAIVVDPGYDVPRILATLAKHQLTARQILVTHAHIDHIASALELKQITGAPILYNARDLPLAAMMDVQASWIGVETPEVKPPDHSPADSEHISIGDIDAQVIHTPGHTEGSVCILVPAHSLLIAGDTLFAGSIGRTDLPGGNYGKLIQSIRERLLPLTDSTIVIPGHGPATTIGEERVSNPFLV